ncbi:SAM-dependent methyltransferase [Nonomuraea gerenzanensis]|uniref:SAM-dependent methyltransferase n=1 Tax=Nonomuraea gerenzanensis TaxID=93944 RepID=UPI001CD970D7|nr:SAM-dependent methyltransferase [Nonomuraea gerenzanensis]UBU16698.1 SAM-dependent methyltransferase [Nonomuraea gerenzanensis]
MSVSRMAPHDAAGGGRYDFTKPSIARVWDFATGGKDNLPPDRDVLDALEQTAGQIRTAARAQVEFVTRATRVIAKEHGIRQWLNLGCGLPPQNGETTYDTAVQHHKGTRVVYVDNDRHVAVHGRALLDIPGAAGLIEGDAWDVDAVLRHEATRSLLDPGQPVGIIATALAHFAPDEQKPASILRRYMAHFPSGYFIFSHARDDLLRSEERAKMIADYKATADIYPRSLDVIGSMFLGGLELLEPGLVEASAWRPDIAMPLDVGRAHFVAAVAAFGRSMAVAS